MFRLLFEFSIKKKIKVILKKERDTYFDCDGLTASLIGDMTALSDSD